MDVNQNFERLEQEVNRLMEVLEKLRKENLEQKDRIQSLEGDISIVSAENERRGRRARRGADAPVSRASGFSARGVSS